MDGEATVVDLQESSETDNGGQAGAGEGSDLASGTGDVAGDRSRGNTTGGDGGHGSRGAAVGEDTADGFVSFAERFASQLSSAVYIPSGARDNRGGDHGLGDSARAVGDGQSGGLLSLLARDLARI